MWLTSFAVSGFLELAILIWGGIIVGTIAGIVLLALLVWYSLKAKTLRAKIIARVLLVVFLCLLLVGGFYLKNLPKKAEADHIYLYLKSANFETYRPAYIPKDTFRSKMEVSASAATLTYNSTKGSNYFYIAEFPLSDIAKPDESPCATPGLALHETCDRFDQIKDRVVYKKTYKDTTAPGSYMPTNTDYILTINNTRIMLRGSDLSKDEILKIAGGLVNVTK